VAVGTRSRCTEVNALSAGARGSFAVAFQCLARGPDVYGVIMRSASERAFSAGSDVREIVALAKAGQAAAVEAFREEYRLNWQLECFSKPCVALIDGMVMGGGVGVSLYGTHRVAGRGYKFAMPETLIGFFPDVGVCHAFSTMPGEIGTYLALTGRIVGRADALALGLITHCIDAEHYPAIIAALADTRPVDPLLDGLHGDPGPGELAALQSVIDRCFAGDDLVAILDRLDRETGGHSAWAKSVAAELRARSPLALALTMVHVRRARDLELKEVLEDDERLARVVLDQHDFFEGVRAQLIDKDQRPAWQPADLAEAVALSLRIYDRAMSAAPWALPSRSDMQAARA